MTIRNALLSGLVAAWLAGCATPRAERPGYSPRQAEQVRLWGLANGWTEVTAKPTTQQADEESLAAGTEAGPVDTGQPCEFTADDRRNGFVVFIPDRNNIGLRDRRPTSIEVARGAVQAVGFPGEFEGLPVAIHALRDLDKMTVTVSDLKNSQGGVIPAANVQVCDLIYAPLSLRNRRDSRNRFQMWPVWLLPHKPEPLKAGQGRVFWLTIRCPEDAAGMYSGSVAISTSQTSTGKNPVTIPGAAISRSIALDIQPFKLDGSLCSWAPVTAGQGFDLAAYQQMAEHHMTGLSWWWGDWGLTVTRVGQGPEARAGFDPALMDYLNAVTKEAGMRGPWILFLGNMIRGHLERRIAGYYRQGRQPPLFDVKLVPIPRTKKTGVQPDDQPSVADLTDSAEMDRRYVEVLQALAAQAREKGYPQIIICPYDEPSKYLFQHNAHWADLVHKHVPELKVLNTPQGSLQWAKNLMPYSDYMDVEGANDPIYDATIKAGKLPMGYARLTANQTFAQARHTLGLRFASQQPNVIYFWSLNFGELDRRTPFNDLNERDSGFRHRFAWPPEHPGGRWVETLVWEAQREGAKDYLLLLMVQKELEKSKSPQAERIRREFESFKADSARHPTNLDSRRGRLVEWLRTLTGKG